MIDSKSNGSGLVPGKDWSSLSAPFGGYRIAAVPGRGPERRVHMEDENDRKLYAG